MDESLPYGIQVETINGLVGIVHADVMFRHWEDNFFGDNYVHQVLTWSRSRIEGKRKSNPVIGLYKLYVGHSVLDEPVVIDNVHHIDIGSCFYSRIHIEKIS